MSSAASTAARHPSLRPAQTSRAEGHVVARRRREQLQFGGLEDETHLALPLRVAGGGRPGSVEQHGAALRLVEAADHLEQRRLAGARSADERQRAAGPQLERHVAQCGDRGAGLLVAERHSRRSDPYRARPARPAGEARPASRRLLRRAAHVATPSSSSSSSIVSGRRGRPRPRSASASASSPAAGRPRRSRRTRADVGEQTGRVARTGLRAVLEGDDAVGADDLVHLLGDVDDGEALGVQLAHGAQHLLATGRVEHGRRLVEHQDATRHGQHAGQRRALLLPAGQQVRLAQTQVLEPESRQHLVDPAADVGGGPAPGSRGRRRRRPRRTARRAGSRGSGTARRRRGARRAPVLGQQVVAARDERGARRWACRVRRAGVPAWTCRIRWRRPRPRTRPRRPRDRDRRGRRPARPA